VANLLFPLLTSDVVTSWLALLSSLTGGLIALAGVVLTQWWTRKRDREARLWARRADAYVALMRWRLQPPDEVAIGDPRLVAEATLAWTEDAYPLLAELSLFGGPGLQAILTKTPFMFRAAGELAKMSAAQLATLVQEDLDSTVASPPRPRRVRLGTSRP
jgi:hypothetical protein